MTRATRFALYASAVTLSYFLVWFSILPMPLIAEETKDQILPLLPWWLLVSFGSYSLASLGLGLWSFRDCPDAYEELMHEINEAKIDLSAKGVTVD